MEVDRYTRGQGLTEYALIFVFVVLIMIVLLSIFGEQLGNIYSDIVARI
ncbi:MAG: Flp family type IVb pilin [Bellilinea sp.]